MGAVIPFVRPTRDTVAVDYLSTVFGPGGLLARATPGYEQREGQVQLARAVDQTCRHGGVALLEGPCGTGKSRAYLVPLIHHACRTRTKAVVVTATIALQEQLFHRELPELQKVLGGEYKFTFGLLKGRGNFVCNEREPSEDLSLTGVERDEFRRVNAWSNSTTTGDRADLPFVPVERVWSKFTLVDSDDCKGKDCPKRAQCFHEKSKGNASKADIIVTNYHTLFAHIALQLEGAPGLLPEFHYLACDEGHETADIAREFFGATIRKSLFTRAAKFFRAEGEWLSTRAKEYDETLAIRASAEAQARNAEQLGDRFMGNLTRFVREQLEQDAKKKNVDPRADGIAHIDTRPTLPTLELRELARETWLRSSAMLEVLDVVEETSGLTKEQKEFRATARSTARKFRKLATWTAELHDVGNDADSHLSAKGNNLAVWGSLDNKGTPALEMRQVNLGPLLARELFARVKSVAVTSATLTVGRRFDFIERELGLDIACTMQATIKLDVPSPFDFANRVMLLTPDVPLPTERGWSESCAGVIKQLVEAADGRTLALFSSKTERDAIYKQMPRGQADKRQWLLQGDMPARALCSAFRMDPRSVLFGTKSYWTGIDVPGDSLTVVTINRIPFPQPDDPIVRKVHKTLGCDAFEKYDLPKALIALRQGFGRLMRSQSDFGVVAILDSRITTRRWGWNVFASLPETLRGATVAEAAEHLALFTHGGGKQ